MEGSRLVCTALTFVVWTKPLPTLGVAEKGKEEAASACFSRLTRIR